MEDKTNPGSMIIVYAVPVKNNDQITGVLFKVADGTSLSTITNSITFGKSGAAYMINDKGTSIANANKDKVLKMDNIIENAKKDPSLKAMADTVKSMLKGGTGNTETCNRFVIWIFLDRRDHHRSDSRQTADIADSDLAETIA